MKVELYDKKAAVQKNQFAISIFKVPLEIKRDQHWKKKQQYVYKKIEITYP